eukprot:TRINITY_DN39452_c0_g1_i1.p1 TRINITY_DN39452_c0_g1~~TRINITY_DN39452_c0_g1_i1.p1  ORF type:complete len:173 (+),score=24.20 TRINITY_DN39452_c0_g1_i1:57-575(+)
MRPGSAELPGAGELLAAEPLLRPRTQCSRRRTWARLSTHAWQWSPDDRAAAQALLTPRTKRRLARMPKPALPALPVCVAWLPQKGPLLAWQEPRRLLGRSPTPGTRSQRRRRQQQHRAASPPRLVRPGSCRTAAAQIPLPSSRSEAVLVRLPSLSSARTTSTCVPLPPEDAA